MGGYQDVNRSSVSKEVPYWKNSWNRSIDSDGGLFVGVIAAVANRHHGKQFIQQKHDEAGIFYHLDQFAGVVCTGAEKAKNCLESSLSSSNF